MMNIYVHFNEKMSTLGSESLTVKRFLQSMGFLLVALVAPFQANGNTIKADITLESGWNYLLESHGALEAARYQVASARALRASTQNLYHPQVEFQIRASRINEPIEINLDPIRQVILNLHPQIGPAQLPEFRTRVQSREFLQSNINFVWPVYTGGRISAARSAASARVLETRAELMQAESELLGEYVRRYYAVALAERAVDLHEAQVASMDQHLSKAVQLKKNGQIARVERLHAEVALDEAKRGHSEALSNLRVAREGLAAWFDQPADQWALASELKLIEPPVAENQQTEQGPGSHPRLRQLDAMSQSAEYAVQAERGALLPEVYLFGRQELNRSDLTALDPEWAVGIGLNWSIWDRDGRRQRVQAARNRTLQLESIRVQAEKDLNTLVIQSIEQWRQSAHRFYALSSTLQLAEENLRVRELGFTEGQATSLDVVDARLTYQRALLAQALSEYETLVLAAQTAESLGSIDFFWQWIQPKDFR